MANDPQLELRVSRLENDVSALYDLIADVNATVQEHSLRFDAVDRRFDAIDRRFDAVDERLHSVDQRLEFVEQRLDSIDSTLVEVLRRLPEPA